MSKAFTKDEGSSDPVVVRPRAPLPPGTPNYVTPRGFERLREELETLSQDRVRIEANDKAEGHAPEHAALVARINELGARLATASVVDPTRQPHDVVRFGAVVAIRSESRGTRSIQIVGVDEANAAEGRIAFVAPLARALLGAAVGDEVLVRTPGGTESLTILSIV